MGKYMGKYMENEGTIMWYVVRWEKSVATKRDE